MKILVVDDSKVMRMMVIRTLRQAGFDGHAVQEAGDGKEALSTIESFGPDLVMSDWNMPDVNGIEFLRSLRAAGKKTPFVFVTSEGTAEMRQLATDAGAQALIAKPFTADAFQSTLREFLQ